MDAPIVPSAGTPTPAAAPNTSNAGMGDIVKAGIPTAKPDAKAIEKAVTVEADKNASKAKETTTAKEVAKAIEKIKLKTGEYTADEIEGLIEKAKGADKKFLEASKARKEAVKFFQNLKSNTRETLEKAGIDFKKLSYDEVAKDVQDKLKDPKDLELEQAKRRLEEFERKDAEAKKSAEEEKQTREAKAMEAKFHSEIIEALEATPSLPKNGFTVAKIAKYIDTVRDKTGVLLSAKDVIGAIEKDFRSEVTGSLSGASAEQIIALIGEEGMAAIRKFDLARLKDPLKGGNGGSSGEDKPKKPSYKNSHDFWKTIDKAAKQERGEYYGKE